MGGGPVIQVGVYKPKEEVREIKKLWGRIHFTADLGAEEIVQQVGCVSYMLLTWILSSASLMIS